MSNNSILDYLYAVQCKDCPLGECCKKKKEIYRDFISPCAKLIASFTID